MTAPGGLEMHWTNLRPIGIGLLTLSLFGTIVSTGCMSNINGQNIPSAYYDGDDLNYAPPGPEFKLAREAAAMREAAAEKAAAER